MKEIYIGRTKGENDVVLEDNRISRRHHCKCVLHDDGTVTIMDLDSTNGVFVDGKKITEETIVNKETLIKIGNLEIVGTDVRKWFEERKIDAVEQCKQMKQKYDDLCKRYRNNLNELYKAMEISKEPFVQVFPSDDEKVSYLVEEYTRKMNEAINMLQLISKSSRKDAMSYRDDMDVLAEICNGVKGSQRDQCLDIRGYIYDQMACFQKESLQEVKDAFQKLCGYYQSNFMSFYETTTTLSPVWDTVNNRRIIALPYLLYGYQDLRFPYFEESLDLQYLQFVPFLNRQNVVVHYDNDTQQTAQSVVNGMIGRLLAGSQSGNIQILVFDSKDLGGTSNMFKMLDRHVYTICARTADMQTQLSMLDRYVENVVQNLLQGPYNSLAAFNKGKENQEPYQIVVFKDFPFGITPEMAHTIQRIIANGIKTGVQFIFMVNDDYLQRSEDCIKIGNILHLEDATALQATTINLAQKLDSIMGKQQYAALDDNKLHEIVQYVNAGFEIKTEEVLRLTDYMIPKEEWWTGQSASRVDIPFGMASNKQIQKLNFTQESGQNAAVVIGIPGSGKSVFLHSLIANAVVNYSPNELQLYLLDFSGVEFDVYARHRLPHARIIAPEAEREFGLSVLEEIYQEGSRRMRLCRENKVTNIVGLKRGNPNIVVPRLLLIIDEFQKIFEIDNDDISKRANKIIHTIIQEYRKFGINLILATQQLPAKSVVPFDLIANRVVFKSNPNNFSQLIKLPPQTPEPRLQVGDCIYNNESGMALANHLTRAFFIDASGDLETLLDDLTLFAKEHEEKSSDIDLRVFRSKEVPCIKLDESFFAIRPVSDSFLPEDNPREVEIYVGENIAIQSSDVSIKLEKGSNQNILIIGGKQNIAQELTICMSFTQQLAYNPQTCYVSYYNFMKQDDPVQNTFDQIFPYVEYMAAESEICNSETEVHESLTNWKEFIDERRKSGEDTPNVFLYFTSLQLGHMFSMNGYKASECSKLLKYILDYGPMVGIFTILHIDGLDSLVSRLESPLKLFNHRIVMQMSESNSTKLIGNGAASKLTDENSPSSAHRAFYYNLNNNTILKFKPYELWHRQ